jgi:hypothetical protein
MDGDTIEIVLPADYMASVEFPLTVDPVISTTIEFGASDKNEYFPDVAYDASNNVYLVVWAERYDIGDYDICAQRVSSSGSLVGGKIFVEAQPGSSPDNPAVANIDASNRFLVVYRKGSPSNVYGRAVNANNGALSSEVLVGSGPLLNDVDQPDVGGYIGGSDQRAMVVWRSIGQGLRARVVHVPSSGTPSIYPSFVVSNSANDSLPSISKNGGQDGEYFIAWQRYFSGSPADHDIYGAVFDRYGSTLVSARSLLTSVGPNEEHLDVAGNGRRWLAVYDREASLGTGDHDIYCLGVERDGGSFRSHGTGILESDVGDDEIRPAVAFTGASYVIAYLDATFTGVYGLYVKTIDPYTYFECTPEVVLDTGLISYDHASVAGRYEGTAVPGFSPKSHEAFVAWQYDGFSGAIKDGVAGVVWRSDDGVIAESVAGCGSGGVARASCARSGNSSFRHRLMGAAPNDLAFLVMGFKESPYVCGPCKFIPDIGGAWFLSGGVTNMYGESSYPMGIPKSSSVVGVRVYDQWLVVPGDKACIQYGLDMSSAITIEIQ